MGGVDDESETDFITRMAEVLATGNNEELYDEVELYNVEREPSEQSKITYLSIIGALATIVAELDQNGERPLPTKQIIRGGKISAKALTDILVKRFPNGRNLSRSNDKIKEALKLIEQYK